MAPMSHTPYDGESPPEDKAAVRRRLRALRRELVPDRDHAADAEAILLAGLAAAHAAGVSRGDWVAAYEAMPVEPPTDALVDALVARGIRVMVPITLEDWDLDWREVGATGADAGAPLGVEALSQATLVFVPAAAVDADGTRLGQGKGCYDRALPRTTAHLVAVVHPWEVVDEVLPCDSHDVPVDGVIAAGVGWRRLRR